MSSGRIFITSILLSVILSGFFLYPEIWAIWGVGACLTFIWGTNGSNVFRGRLGSFLIDGMIPIFLLLMILTIILWWFYNPYLGGSIAGVPFFALVNHTINVSVVGGFIFYLSGNPRFVTQNERSSLLYGIVSVAVGVVWICYAIDCLGMLYYGNESFLWAKNAQLLKKILPTTYPIFVIASVMISLVLLIYVGISSTYSKIKKYLILFGIFLFMLLTKLFLG